MFGGKTTEAAPEKFSLENFNFLAGAIHSMHADAANPQTLVDAMRDLVEVVVWGDKYNETIFDVFMASNIISLFADAMVNPEVHPDVKVQVFQCFTILLGNLTRQESIYWVMSGNHINRIISSDLDFSSDEIVSNYISFVKALSQKLNRSLVQFFFSQQTASFPLYEHSVRLFDHVDRLVRTSVRQIVVNVVRIDDPHVQEFATGRMPDFVAGIARFCLRTIGEMSHAMETAAPTNAVLDAVMEDIIDDLHFLSELYAVANDSMKEATVEVLREKMLNPLSLAARENNDCVALLLLSNWCRVLSIVPLSPAVVDASVATASVLLSSPSCRSHHPIALGLIVNAIALHEKSASGCPFPSPIALVDTIMFACRTLLVHPKERSTYVLAAAISAAYAAARVIDAAAGIERLRKSLRATLWWLQQWLLSTAEPRDDDAEALQNTSIDALRTPEQLRRARAAPDAPSDSEAPTAAAKAAASETAWPDGVCDSTPLTPVRRSTYRRNRAQSEFHEAGYNPGVASAREMADDRIFAANLDLLHEALATVSSGAAALPTLIRQQIGKVGKDVWYLRWARHPAVVGDDLRRAQITAVLLLRSALASLRTMGNGPITQKAPPFEWTIDAEFSELGMGFAFGRQMADRVATSDCVRVQVCAVDDVDASVNLVERAQSTVKGVTLGTLLHLTFVGSQLVLLQFPEPVGDAAEQQPLSGKVVLCQPLAFACAVMDSERPFRLHISTEISDKAVAPVKELGVVFRDRVLCRAVASRLNEIALAARQICRERLDAFLSAPSGF